MNRNG